MVDPSAHFSRVVAPVGLKDFAEDAFLVSPTKTIASSSIFDTVEESTALYEDLKAINTGPIMYRLHGINLNNVLFGSITSEPLRWASFRAEGCY